MKNKGMIIGVLAFVAIVMWFVMGGLGRDESMDDRVENYNHAMESTMRSTGRRAEIEEELAEEKAMLEAQQGSASGQEGSQ